MHKQNDIKDQDLIDITVTAMAYGGQGIGRKDGKVYFVDDAVPGDQVRVRVTSEKASYAVATVVSELGPNPLRGPSPCRYSSTCGGCQWLNIPYSEQLQWKANFISDAFRRVGGWALPEGGITVLPSPDTAHYRNRILLRGTIFEDGSLQLGFFKKATREQIHVERCFIADDSLNQVIAAATKLRLTCPPQTFRLELQALPYFRDEQSAHVFATVHPTLTRGHQLEALVDELSALPAILWAGLQSELKDAPMAPFESWRGTNFYTAPAQFQQVNLLHNHTLRAKVKEVAEGLHKPRVLDLCCGSGNLSLGLGPDADCEGVEFNSKAIAIARLAAERNGRGQRNYLSRDATRHLAQCVQQKKSFDLVILDPPRAGLKEGMRHLKQLRPTHILYVSCDPFTLARDLGVLRDSYDMVSLTGLDFFPHTYHVETIVHLKAKTSP